MAFVKVAYVGKKDGLEEGLRRGEAQRAIQAHTLSGQGPFETIDGLLHGLHGREKMIAFNAGAVSASVALEDVDPMALLEGR